MSDWISVNDKRPPALTTVLGDYWGEVIRLYSQRWGQIGKDALKKVQKQALERIYAVAR